MVGGESRETFTQSLHVKTWKVKETKDENVKTGGPRQPLSAPQADHRAGPILSGPLAFVPHIPACTVQRSTHTRLYFGSAGNYTPFTAED